MNLMFILYISRLLFLVQGHPLATLYDLMFNRLGVFYTFLLTDIDIHELVGLHLTKKIRYEFSSSVWDIELAHTDC